LSHSSISAGDAFADLRNRARNTNTTVLVVAEACRIRAGGSAEPVHDREPVVATQGFVTGLRLMASPMTCDDTMIVPGGLLVAMEANQ
jgi:hypothetical protein